ncbi:hypothetical protein K1719_044338 [Acacia pycnantha]|nr:hypothetical protein K1719_044338 [Acacia pycnantha]
MARFLGPRAYHQATSLEAVDEGENKDNKVRSIVGNQSCKAAQKALDAFYCQRLLNAIRVIVVPTMRQCLHTTHPKLIHRILELNLETKLGILATVDNSEQAQESTIGAAFFTPVLSLNESTMKFDVWDTAAQERYHSLAPLYYRGAATTIVVYDITGIDKMSNCCSSSGMMEFQNCVESSNLLYVVQFGLSFTWSNNSEGGHFVMERFNGVFCNLQWLNLFPRSHSTTLAIAASDHCPIIFSTDGYSHK